MGKIKQNTTADGQKEYPVTVGEAVVVRDRHGNRSRLDKELELIHALGLTVSDDGHLCQVVEDDE